MLRREKGFTLIELLIVIAIIGILAAIAIPMYQSQTIKAKMTEVTNAMSNIESAINAKINEDPDWPDSALTLNTAADIQSELGVSVASIGRASAWTVTITAQAGRQTSGTAATISATLQNCGTAVDGENLVLTGTAAADGSITWAWSGTIPAAYIPRR